MPNDLWAGALAPTTIRRTLVAVLLTGVAAPALAQAGPTTPESTESTATGQAATSPGDAAQAATATGGSDAAMSDQTQGDSTPQADGGQLQDIVVTATKRETNLQRTPIAISVVNTQALEDRHVQSLADLADGSVPGLRVATFEARQSALTIGIRGIVPLDANQPAREQGVGVYVDGVYLGRQQGLGAALLDVERIEVLKGPQGTLFGRNTSAGLISIITARPSFTPSASGEVTIGNYDYRRIELGATTGLTETIAARIDGVYQKRDGFLEDVISGRSINNRDRWLLRGQLLFKPNDAFSLRLIGDYAKRNEECCGAVFLPARDTLANANGTQTLPSTIAGIERGLGAQILDNPYDRQVAITPGRDYRSDVKDGGVSAEAVYDFGGVELTSITAYRYNNYIRGQDADFNNLDLLYRAGDGNSFNRFKTFSQELRFQGTTFGDRLDWLVGGYYANEKLRVQDNLAYGADYSRYANCLVALNFAQSTGQAALVSPASATCFQPLVATGIRAALIGQYNAALAGGNLTAAAAAAGTITTLGAFAGLNNTGLPAGIPAANFSAAPFGTGGFSNLALASGAGARTFTGVGVDDLMDQESNNLALFTHNIFTLAQDLKLTVGARYTRERKTLDVDLRDTTANATNLCAFYSAAVGALQQVPCVIPSLPGGQLVGSDKRTESKLSGTVVLSYKPTDRLLTYASYSRGYKAGGYNLDRSALSRFVALNSSGVPVAGAVCPTSGTVPAACVSSGGLASISQLEFKPEINDAFELGAKFNGNGIDFNVALFRQVFRDFQLNTFNGVNFFVENVNSCKDSLNGADVDNVQVVGGVPGSTGACTGDLRGGVKSRGVEFELFTRPLTDVNFNFGATLADTKYRNNLVGADGRALSTALFQLPGRRLSNSSLWTLSSSIAWTPRIGDSGLRGLVYLDARHQSAFNTGSDLDLEKMENGYTVVNGRLGIRGPGGMWAVELWAQNLFKEDFKQVAFDGTLQGSCTIRGAQQGFCSPVPNLSTQLFGAFLAEPRTFGLTLRGKI